MFFHPSLMDGIFPSMVLIRGKDCADVWALGISHCELISGHCGPWRVSAEPEGHPAAPFAFSAHLRQSTKGMHRVGLRLN